MENIFLINNYLPLSGETAYTQLAVTGKIPENLSGIFYRNGPNPAFTPSEKYHLFDGDGMVHAFYFKNNQVFYQNKFIKTEKFNIEKRAGKSIFRGILDYQKNKLNFNMINKAHNTSNTNLLWHHKKLYSLWEFGCPYEIDPDTLETIGRASFSESAFTAHPKIDPDNQALLALSYNGCLELPACNLKIFSKLNKLSQNINLKIPYRSMMHDFRFTKNYIILPVFPAVLDFSGASQNLINWHPEKFSYIGFLPRDLSIQNSDAVIWFKLPACYVYHFANSYEEKINNNNYIIIDAIIHDSIPLFQEARYAKLIRWTFNLTQKKYEQYSLDENQDEKVRCHYFPHYDSRYSGKFYSHIFTSAREKEEEIIFHLDLITQKKNKYTAEKDFILSEPVFVPAGDNVPEGHGWLLCLQTSYLKNRAELLIFDAQNIHRPVSVVHLPHRIAFGFHGLWVADR